MKQLFFCIVSVLSAVVPSCVAAQDEDEKYAVDLLPTGTTAPDFTLQTPDGTPVSLGDYAGKYVVLDFWASWCPDCVKDAPNIVQLAATYGPRGVQFIGISFDDDKSKWTAAIERFGIDYTQVSELRKWKDTEISAAYCIKWIPSLYLIGPDGKVVLATVMSEKIGAALAKLSPECETPAPCCAAE